MNRKMFEIEQTLAALNAGSTRSYRLWPLPSYLDQEISEMVQTFSELSEVEKTLVRQKITTLRSSWMLQTYAERMAQVGIQEKSETAFFRAALALVLEDFREVGIDGFILLSLLVEESARCLDEPNQFWERVRGLATSKTARFIDQALRTTTGRDFSTSRLVA